MHELSIAQNIVEIIKQNIPPDALGAVAFVHLKVGNLSGVVADSLDFSYTALNNGTQLEKSRLVIERIPFVVFCNPCNSSAENPSGIVICERCGNLDTKVLSGTELEITEIELEEIEKVPK
jgi:hydrogenase nickel incorporation protein HypA/HybF